MEVLLGATDGTLVTEYEGADGAKSKTTYDAYGRGGDHYRPARTETMHYDETSGVMTSMEVSGSGTFTTMQLDDRFFGYSRK